MMERWAGDDELAVDLRARDGDAWAVAYVRCLGSMRAVAARFVSLDQVDDIVHDVFAQFWDRPEVFDPQRGSLRNYLSAMTRSRSIDASRSEQSRRARQRRHHDDRGLRPLSSVEADAMAAVTTEQLIAVIRMLPRGEREAIGLAYFRHLTYQEVARLLALPEGTVKSRIRSGLGRMRTALVELGQDPARQTLPTEPPIAEEAVWEGFGPQSSAERGEGPNQRGD